MHGFTKGRSCLMNFLQILEEVYEKLNEGRAVDVVYNYTCTWISQRQLTRYPHKRRGANEWAWDWQMLSIVQKSSVMHMRIDNVKFKYDVESLRKEEHIWAIMHRSAGPYPCSGKVLRRQHLIFHRITFLSLIPPSKLLWYSESTNRRWNSQIREQSSDVTSR